MNYWTESEIALAIRLRQTMKPDQIASILGRTTGTVHRKLSIEKAKRRLYFPKLRPANLKWDKAKVSEWRALCKTMKQCEVARIQNVSPYVISRKFAQEIHGEIRF